MPQTSNYASLKKIIEENPNANVFSISVGPPKYVNMAHLPDFAPSWQMVKDIRAGIITEEQYTKKYLALLHQRKITPEVALKIIPEDAILLCYESPGEFCHRRILAEWLITHTGVRFDEWMAEKDRKKAELHETLFDF